MTVLPAGRLVIPCRAHRPEADPLRRIAENQFDEEDFGAVMFVPPIGSEGWGAPERETAAEIDSQSTGFADGLHAPASRARAIRTGLSRLIAEQVWPARSRSGFASAKAGKRESSKPLPAQS